MTARGRGLGGTAAVQRKRRFQLPEGLAPPPEAEPRREVRAGVSIINYIHLRVTARSVWTSISVSDGCRVGEAN